MKDILVFLHDGPSNEERINTAIYLAEMHGSQLTGAALATLKPMYAKVKDDKKLSIMSQKLAQELADDFLDRVKPTGLKASTIIVKGGADKSAMRMAQYARNHDLIVLHQPNPARENHSRLMELAEQVMLHSGRPIFFMPYIGAHRIPCQKALIAWDGSPSATRAVHDAIPVLKCIQNVEILVVLNKKVKSMKKGLQEEGLASHLQHHGINASIHYTKPGKNDVETVILNHIPDNDIDLLVMGGYGTPALQQKIFGGVTRSLMSSMVVPVLMSH